MREYGPLRRRVKVVLALSLALNLLFVGVFAGAIWRNADGPGGHGRATPPGLQSYAAPYVRALPRADKRALRNALREGHPHPSRVERQAGYAKMLVALRAEPFDAAAVAAVLSGQKSNVLAVQDAAQAQWLSAIESMDAQARKAYADSLEEELKRGPRRRGRHSDRKQRASD